MICNFLKIQLISHDPAAEINLASNKKKLLNFVDDLSKGKKWGSAEKNDMA